MGIDKLSRAIAVCVAVFVFHPFPAHSDVFGTLPWFKSRCISGSMEDVNAKLSELGVKSIGSGEISDGSRLYFLSTLSYEYLYLVNLNKVGNSLQFCLKGGGREVDLVAANRINQMSREALWPRRENRYHLEMAIRQFSDNERVFPTLAGMRAGKISVFATAFQLNAGRRDSYDEVLDLKTGGSTESISRGDLMRIANREMAKMNNGTEKYNERQYRDHQRIFEITDHHLDLIFVAVSPEDKSWAIIVLKRKKREIEFVLYGTDFRIQ